MKKLIIQVILAAAIVYLGYLCYNSIMIPQRFTQLKEVRYEAIIERLKDIRTAQEAFKDQYGRYTGSFDTLINFVKHDSIKKVRSIGSISDADLEKGMTEEMAIRQGLILRDTVKVPAITDIFVEGFQPDQLRFVPFTKGKYQFKMLATSQTSDQGVTIPLFEARVSNMQIFDDVLDTYLEQLEEENGQRIRINKYPGLKVGDIEEANNNVGNWE